MTLYEFFSDTIGLTSSSPVEFCFLSFVVIFILSDFIHVFFTAVSSWFKK